MSLRKKSLKAIVFTILLGIALGTVVGEVLALALPDGIPKDVLIQSAHFELQPFTLNLMVITLTFGISMKMNLISVLGILVMVQLLKWSW